MPKAANLLRVASALALWAKAHEAQGVGVKGGIPVPQGENFKIQLRSMLLVYF